MMASLPATLPIKRWGSTESAIGNSHAILERCLSAYQDLCATTYLRVPLQHPETLELIERMKALDAKLASRAVPNHISQSPSQTHTERRTPIMGMRLKQRITNDSVTQTQPRQAAPDLDEASLGEHEKRMPKPVQHSLRFEEGPPMPVTPNYQ
ncbi:hypothetical protein EI94DRAFT_1753968 [Lactarius quietus]|nr:hypothetical protein EI94DRAFT_1753968 [Lactarius quietus]